MLFLAYLGFTVYQLLEWKSFQQFHHNITMVSLEETCIEVETEVKVALFYGLKQADLILEFMYHLLNNAFFEVLEINHFDSQLLALGEEDCSVDSSNAAWAKDLFKLVILKIMVNVQMVVTLAVLYLILTFLVLTLTVGVKTEIWRTKLLTEIWNLFKVVICRVRSKWKFPSR